MAICVLCGKSTFDLNHEIEHFVIESIKQSHPEWVEADGACPACIDYYRRLDHPEDID